MHSVTAVKKELDKIGVAYLENALMSAHTTFRIGGPAALYVRPQNREELVAAARVIQTAEIPITTIGKGSNLLVSDAGYPGAILSTEGVTDIAVVENTVTCDCGVSVTGAAIAARGSGLSGMEFLYGIPGSAAGAVFMNAGAYGGEIADILSSSTYYDMETGAVAHVCYVNRIPFLAVRSITDTSGDSGAEAFDRNCERASEIAAEVTSGLLRSWI